MQDKQTIHSEGYQMHVCQQKGVPFFETCKLLAPHFEYNTFAWEHDNVIDSISLITLDPEREWDFLEGDKRFSYVPAPQMHEIARLLPHTISKDKDNFYLDLETIEGGAQQLHYVDKNGVYCGEICKGSRVKNHHYAQAYAELYLKLREAGLLKKEAQDA